MNVSLLPVDLRVLILLHVASMRNDAATCIQTVWRRYRAFVWLPDFTCHNYIFRALIRMPLHFFCPAMKHRSLENAGDYMSSCLRFSDFPIKPSEWCRGATRASSIKSAHSHSLPPQERPCRTTLHLPRHRLSTCSITSWTSSHVA